LYAKVGEGKSTHVLDPKAATRDSEMDYVQAVVISAKVMGRAERVLPPEIRRGMTCGEV
jgi:hypothetical protein